MTATEDPQSLVNRIIAELEARPEVKPTLLRALLTDEFLLLPSKVDRLMELVPAVETLQEDVSGLKEGQARLEEGQVRLNAGQNRMGGELSSLTGSQFQRHVAEIGYRLVRREWGFQDAHLLEADSAPGKRMIIDITDAAEDAGRITVAESDEVILSDVIVVGVDEASQPVQVLLEVSLTVQQSDIERAQTRARILEKATGIRTLARVVGQSIPEEERTLAQERGVTCFAVQSGLPPR